MSIMVFWRAAAGILSAVQWIRDETSEKGFG
jgi:hypothetical protein